jgi:branched-chain amino acid transport system ATP-binding protein
MSAALRVEEICTSYGLSRVLFGISLEVAANECVCLLGRNGMGKTTTMRSIVGLTPASRGRVFWKGADITNWRSYEIARAGIGYVPEDRRIFDGLTVWENLEVAHGVCTRSGPWNYDSVYQLFPKLAERSRQLGRHLSGGEQQMLTIARTLMCNPELLILDEPSEGLAPLIVEQLLDCIFGLKKRGMAILLAEQGIDFSLKLADRVYVLEKGKIRYNGSAASLRDNMDLRRELLEL